MHEAVKPPPALAERFRHGVDLLLLVDVHLQDLRARFHAPGTLLGQAHHPPKAGQHDLRTLPLSHLGDGEGNAARRKHTRHQDLLALEDHPPILTPTRSSARASG